ncbi:hypothetical protein SSS_01183 [Sarcoptes scabiei]|nr:hypothetical protein SSS_01183 [Sarcoptes scabiei]
MFNQSYQNQKFSTETLNYFLSNKNSNFNKKSKLKSSLSSSTASSSSSSFGKGREKLKQLFQKNLAKFNDDPFAVIIARAILLFLTTFTIFLNAYVMMSLDRDDLIIGSATIIISIVGQFAAITGQFGYKIGDLLLRSFTLAEILFLLVSSFILIKLWYKDPNDSIEDLLFCITKI